MKQLLVLGLGILMACLSACSDDDPKEPQNAPRSLITEFVRPGSLFHEESAFNVQFVLNEETSKIDGVKVLDFDITAPGYSIDFSTDPVFFVQQLKEIGYLNAPENLPSDCELYRPSIRPIRTISISAKHIFGDNPLQIQDTEDCSRFFGVSYVSYYDFIKNGYSWDGIANAGPIYRMALDEFNKAGDKKLVDTNGITLYLPEELQPCVRNYMYTIRIEYADGIYHNFECRPVSDRAWERLRSIIDKYNRGYISFPDWNLLKAPRR